MAKITEKVVEALLADKGERNGYWDCWKANIAVSMIDAARDEPEFKDVTYEVLHRVANAGAERFLELLTREK